MEKMKNFPFKHDGKTFWYSRSNAAVALIYTSINGKLHVLCNRRGAGAPNYNGYLNCVCGYLEHNESLPECACKECYEETGLVINPSELIQLHTNSSEYSDNQNVSTVFMSFISYDRFTESDFSTEHSETDEVDGIYWMPVDESLLSPDTKFAFNHGELILRYSELGMVYSDITSNPESRVILHSIVRGSNSEYVYEYHNTCDTSEDYEITTHGSIEYCTVKGKTRPLFRTNPILIDKMVGVTRCYLLDYPEVEFYIC